MNKKQLKEIESIEATIAEMDKHIAETEQMLIKFKDTRQKMFTKLLCYKYMMDIEE